MQTVNILVRNNPLNHRVLVKMVRERKLDEYAVDLRVHVELEKQVLQLLLRRHRWSEVVFAADPNLLTSLVFRFEIGRRRRVITHEDSREVRIRLGSFEPLDLDLN